MLAIAFCALHHCLMLIREARTEDAVEACHVVRRSITELCLADHQDDPAILEKWLANKTPANVRSWIARPDAHMFVATNGKAIVGVAAVTTSGEVTLNYVSPDARFRGVSKALLKRLEAKATELGNERCVLTSTDTARAFYLSAGYEEQGFPMTGFFTSLSRRMAKQLSGDGRSFKPKIG
jgi:GNAT superfamily N-acetyltransferase